MRQPLTNQHCNVTEDRSYLGLCRQLALGVIIRKSPLYFIKASTARVKYGTLRDFCIFYNLYLFQYVFARENAFSLVTYRILSLSLRSLMKYPRQCNIQITFQTIGV